MYSMGMRQRLGVAACLLGDPELLILDEPMNGLDPAGMQDMREMILSLVAEGRTVVLSSHLLDEVERTCDAVAIVDRGKVVRQGPISELLAGTSVELDVGCSDPDRARRSSPHPPSVPAVVRRSSSSRPGCGSRSLRGRGAKSSPRSTGFSSNTASLCTGSLCSRRHSSPGSFRSRVGSGNRSDGRRHCRFTS